MAFLRGTKCSPNPYLGFPRTVMRGCKQEKKKNGSSLRRCEWTFGVDIYINTACGSILQ